MTTPIKVDDENLDLQTRAEVWHDHSPTPIENPVDIERLDDPKAFLNAFDPTYVVVVKESVRGRLVNTHYWGPDGESYRVLSPGVTYGWVQVDLEFQKAVDFWSKYSNECCQVEIELQLVNLAVAQKNYDIWLAKREANRRAYQRRQERERLNPALAERRKLARVRRKLRKKEERRRRWAELEAQWQAEEAQLDARD